MIKRDVIVTELKSKRKNQKIQPFEVKNAVIRKPNLITSVTKTVACISLGLEQYLSEILCEMAVTWRSYFYPLHPRSDHIDLSYR